MNTAAIGTVQVHLDAPELGPRRQIGSLRRVGRGDAPIAFAYDSAWVENQNFFVIDPAHFPYPGDQFPAQGGTISAVFADCAPDRWGRMVMERREAEMAAAEGRRPRSLDEWDFLLQVDDMTRMGALRFASSHDGPFLSDDEDGVPPLTDLADLQRAARVLESPTADARATHSALARLLAPGSSLGGARPKATLMDSEGRAWIAKFPAANDRRNVGAWEFVLNELARRAGVDVPDTSIERVAGDYHTFLARRFDRDPAGGRRLYASAMTMAGRLDHQAAGYADIAEAVELHGAPGMIADDLAQLFRRLIFNVLTGHRDDHLRNHGFLRTREGWRLSPAFDLNPMPEMTEHQLAVGRASHSPDIDTAVAELAPLCRIAPQSARSIVNQVRGSIENWRVLASAAGIPRPEIVLMGAAFAT